MFKYISSNIIYLTKAPILKEIEIYAYILIIFLSLSSKTLMLNRKRVSFNCNNRQLDFTR